MSNEEIVKEIDEATNLMTEAKVKMNVALNLARGVIMKGNTVDTEAYNKGLNDAWELAKKLWHNDVRTNDDIYGIEYFIDIANDYTPQEALAKLEVYEKEQNEIKVGDVVEGKGSNTIGVVMRKNADDYCHILFRDGSVGQHEIGNFKKTGKHIDIQSLLEQIKE